MRTMASGRMQARMAVDIGRRAAAMRRSFLTSVHSWRTNAGMVLLPMRTMICKDVTER